jgi:hypothetical protein
MVVVLFIAIFLSPIHRGYETTTPNPNWSTLEKDTIEIHVQLHNLSKEDKVSIELSTWSEVRVICYNPCFVTEWDSIRIANNGEVLDLSVPQQRLLEGETIIHSTTELSGSLTIRNPNQQNLIVLVEKIR